MEAILHLYVGIGTPLLRPSRFAPAVAEATLCAGLENYSVALTKVQRIPYGGMVHSLEGDVDATHKT